MLLSDVELDTPEIRSALLKASRDPDSVIRGEALCGLAQRDNELALPLVKAELMGDDVAIPTLDAAQKLADLELVAPLKNWLKEDRTDQVFDRWLLDAIHACDNTDVR